MAETVESVTQWANTTFGPCELLRRFERADEEMEELWFKLTEAADHAAPEGSVMESITNEMLAEEAADVVICLYSLIGTLDPQAIEKKMAKNRARKWVVAEDGTAQHIEERESNP